MSCQTLRLIMTQEAKTLTAISHPLAGQKMIGAEMVVQILADQDVDVIFGFSGGAAVSVYVAAQDPRISSVAACACPADFFLLTEADKAETYVDHFREMGAIRDDDFPPSTQGWLEGFRKVSPIDYVSQIAPRPLLIVHSKDDDTVSISHAHRLHEKADEPKKLVELDGADHKLRHDDRVVDTVIEWFKGLQ